MSKTVCIVGMAPTSRHLVTQLEDEGQEIWSLNQAHNYFSAEFMPRFSRWFQVHPWEEMVPRQSPENNHLEFLRTCGIPVYLEEENPEVPTSVKYPYMEVSSFMGGVYLTSALAFMLALAVYEGFDEIRIYGVDMATNTEYEDQRPCFEFLLGMARARGTAVWLPPGCPLLKGPLYAKTVYVTTSTIEKRMRHWLTQRDEALADFNKALGKVEAATEIGAMLPLETYRTELDLARAAYNALAGKTQACDELLALALKGDGGRVNAPGKDRELVHRDDGYVDLAEEVTVWSDDFLLVARDTKAVPTRPMRTLDNLDNSLLGAEERAEDLIAAHNGRVSE